MAIIELKNVSYGYGANERDNVLCDVSCTFECGKIYAVAGRSGSGKSTLLSMMAGLDLPDAGQVLFEGEPTDRLDRDLYRRQKIAIIYQDFSLFPLLTVLENIMYPLELCGTDAVTAKKTAAELARKVALPDELFDRYPSKISGGEQQRVAIARALTMDRKLILADEPTGNLDSENSAAIIDILSELAHKDGRCIIIVTHDLTVMERADTVYRIADGRLISV
ncbi:MAG TPA: ABC transporter ATP-binding protein [Oscillospiraceae bacterium]|nr:ABC transporter ATP-binding protein [Oscillospiraceae bacterium]HPF55949.1 ABC transporter ATP-binding protein [Clostridiales bacterium]HPK36166.1 ABC transporter ATP-binding protein [Oscillospiraceae bacterium]HPR76544.1 ABC transporter ATP-binding protein [Oscillospiraceae bacterium]